jgi:predicted ATPase
MWIVFGRVSLNWILFKERLDQARLEALRESLGTMRALGIGAFVPYFETRLACAYQQVGRVGEALQLLDETRESMVKTGECWWEAEVYRLKGEFLLSRSENDSAAARSCFEKALEIAREGGVRSLEMRATASLGMLPETHGETGNLSI